MSSSLAIILIGYYGDDWLPACVESLAKSSSGRPKLILVDNAGNTCIDQLDLSPFNARVVRPPEKLGFADANNFGLRFIGADVDTVCFLNQDTKSGPGWLDECIEVLTQNPPLGAISPTIYTYDWQAWDPNFFDCACRAGHFPAKPPAEPTLPRLHQVPEITAAAMLVRNDVLRKVGPFDPVFGSYYEDYDLCRRVRRAGFDLGIAGLAKIAHFSGSATSDDRALRRRARLIVRNRVIHQMRDAGANRLGAFLRYSLYRLPYNLGRSLWGTPSSQRLSTLVGGHIDLLPLLDRLLSEQSDERHWQKYLDELGWPPSATDHASQMSSETEKELLA